MFKAVQKIFFQGCLSIPYFVDFKEILLQVLFQKLKSRAARSFFIVGESCGGGGGEWTEQKCQPPCMHVWSYDEKFWSYTTWNVLQQSQKTKFGPEKKKIQSLIFGVNLLILDFLAESLKAISIRCNSIRI